MQQTHNGGNYREKEGVGEAGEVAICATAVRVITFVLVVVFLRVIFWLSAAIWRRYNFLITRY